MSGEVAYLILVVAAFSLFMASVGGLQYWLSREPSTGADKSVEPAGARRAH